ncbi:hypothetical protein SDC9_95674 [bioreactor metagenome]|uniref:Uncharacterized protein n=1 Tax=bioreactor metagenome TaxID=1076179 RepID=A0A645A7A8_9ZZZZ
MEIGIFILICVFYFQFSRPESAVACGNDHCFRIVAVFGRLDFEDAIRIFFEFKRFFTEYQLRVEAVHLRFQVCDEVASGNRRIARDVIYIFFSIQHAGLAAELG